jgi:hypothetical protein
MGLFYFPLKLGTILSVPEENPEMLFKRKIIKKISEISFSAKKTKLNKKLLQIEFTA